MPIETNNNKDGDYFPITLDVSSKKSDIDLHLVFKALESIGFRFIDHYENCYWIFVQ
jgi:hypothetical protein